MKSSTKKQANVVDFQIGRAIRAVERHRKLDEAEVIPRSLLSKFRCQRLPGRGLYLIAEEMASLNWTPPSLLPNEASGMSTRQPDPPALAGSDELNLFAKKRELSCHRLFVSRPLRTSELVIFFFPPNPHSSHHRTPPILSPTSHSFISFSFSIHSFISPLERLHVGQSWSFGGDTQTGTDCHQASDLSQHI